MRDCVVMGQIENGLYLQQQDNTMLFQQLIIRVPLPYDITTKAVNWVCKS